MPFELKIPESLSRLLRLPISSPKRQQLKVLKKLLRKSRFTEFGQKFLFDKILLSRHPGKTFQTVVPTYNYEKILNEWWHRALAGKPDVCWPGIIKFFALSSGTSESSSKYIPITKELIRANTITSIRQLLSLASYTKVPKSSVGKGWLMLGGSTHLQKTATYYAGDLTGIQAKNIPFWFQGMYKPGKKIARQRDWAKKLDEIVEKAPDWDIAFLVCICWKTRWYHCLKRKIL